MVCCSCSENFAGKFIYTVYGVLMRKSWPGRVNSGRNILNRIFTHQSLPSTLDAESKYHNTIQLNIFTLKFKIKFKPQVTSILPHPNPTPSRINLILPRVKFTNFHCPNYGHLSFSIFENHAAKPPVIPISAKIALPQSISPVLCNCLPRRCCKKKK